MVGRRFNMVHQPHEHHALTDEDMRELEHMTDPPYEQEDTDIM